MKRLLELIEDRADNSSISQEMYLEWAAVLRLLDDAELVSLYKFVLTAVAVRLSGEPHTTSDEGKTHFIKQVLAATGRNLTG